MCYSNFRQVIKMLRFLTAGESHGPGLTAILEGMPAGLKIDPKKINHELGRRQAGYGRGGRMKIEKDEVKITAGIRFGTTLGSPIAFFVENLDWPNWVKIMSQEEISERIPPVTHLRPGHADFAGLVKYGQRDIRNILERASARETAMRVAVGAICRQFLENFDLAILSFVTNIGGIEAVVRSKTIKDLKMVVENSPVRTPDKSAEKQMIARLDRVRQAGDSVGGIFEVIVEGVPPGLGSCMHWDRRLSGQLAAAIMSIPSVKGIEIGAGFEAANYTGSEIHDEIFIGKKGIYRRTNNAGGLEGGMTNGEPLVLRAAVKPIATIKKQLQSVDVHAGKPARSHFERSDVCVVPAAGVVAEAMVAFVLASAFLEKFGGDSIKETIRNYKEYLKNLPF
jgi:chorismate synthase